MHPAIHVFENFMPNPDRSPKFPESSRNRPWHDLLRHRPYRRLRKAADHSQCRERAHHPFGHPFRRHQRHRRHPGQAECGGRAGEDRRFREARDGQEQGAVSSRVQREDLFRGGAFGADHQETQERRGKISRRSGDGRGDHGAGLFQRCRAHGHPARRPARRVQCPAGHQRTDGGGAGLRPRQAGLATRPSSSSTLAAARST